MANRRFLAAALMCALGGCTAGGAKTGEVAEPSDGRYDCAGAGCDAAPEPRLSDHCLFGETYGDFLDSPNFESVESRDLRADSELSELVQAQIMATFDVYGDSITDPFEAFEIVDEGYINYHTVRDRFDGREYTSLEFGAGDNGFGAILRGGTADVAAAIQDSFLEGCDVFEPADRWRIEAEAIDPDPSLVEAFPGRIHAMRLTNGYAPGYPLAISTHEDLVNAARATVHARNECTGFPYGADTELEDYWDPWYVDRWMGAGHVQEGWVDAPTTEQRATLQAWFEARGSGNVTGYQGAFEADACGGSGAGYFFLFLDEVTAEVTILIVYRWTD